VGTHPVLALLLRVLVALLLTLRARLLLASVRLCDTSATAPLPRARHTRLWVRYRRPSYTRSSRGEARTHAAEMEKEQGANGKNTDDAPPDPSTATAEEEERPSALLGPLMARLPDLFVKEVLARLPVYARARLMYAGRGRGSQILPASSRRPTPLPLHTPYTPPTHPLHTPYTPFWHPSINPMTRRAISAGP